MDPPVPPTDEQQPDEVVSDGASIGRVILDNMLQLRMDLAIDPPSGRLQVTGMALFCFFL